MRSANSARQRAVSSIEKVIGDRDLVWFGIRASDASSLLQVRQFSSAFGITSPLKTASLERSTTIEELTGRRVDLDLYDIDFDARSAVHRMRHDILVALNRPSVALSYRPSHFMAAIAFATRRTSSELGLFKERQQAFEHKPWVEVELERHTTVPVIPWEYVASEHRKSASRKLAEGPIILRPAKTSGGVGISLVSTEDELERKWLDDQTHFMGVAPFIGDAAPLNLAGCVFQSGEVTLHPLSAQLIGVGELTDREFGYCGNDFGYTQTLPRSIVAEAEQATRQVGAWLAAQKYVGAFGVDFLLQGDQLFFAEINPRLQGSTSLASYLSGSSGHPDLLLDHALACLGCDPVESLTLVDWINEIDGWSQLVQHNTTGSDQVDMSPIRLADQENERRRQLVPDPEIVVEPGGVVCRTVVPARVTDTGFELRPGLTMDSAAANHEESK